jgi:hypothetical protein
MKRNPCEQHSNMAAQVAGDGYSCIYCLYSLAEKDNADLQSKLDRVVAIARLGITGDDGPKGDEGGWYAEGQIDLGRKILEAIK